MSKKFINNTDKSIQKVSENLCIANVDGKYKTLISKYDVIEETLNASEGKTLHEIKKYFLNRYTAKEIENFINTLVNEKLLLNSEHVRKEKLKKTVSVIYKGNLYKKIKKSLEQSLDIREEFNFDNFNLNYNCKSEIIVIVMSGTIWNEALHINKKLYNLEKPYLFCYFDGKGIVLGPLVFPWKTICLECIAEHHVQKLKKNLKEEIDIKHFKQLNLSFEIEDEQFNYLDFNTIANKIVLTVNKIGVKGSIHELIGCEYRYEKERILDETIKRYTPITMCNCCHAYNKKYSVYHDQYKFEKNIDMGCRHSDKIKYSTAGMRSLSISETKEVLMNALEKTGIDIEILLNENNPFSDIIPVYDSYLKDSHENEMGLILEKQVSHGKGINKEQAYFSAGFEIFERISSRYFGEKEIVSARPRDVKNYAIELSKLDNNVYNRNTPFDSFDNDKYVDWVRGRSLVTGEEKLVPASMVFFSNVMFQGNFFPLSSSGLAAGGTLDDAVLQGLFELIEHDAWIMGQSIPSKLPILDFNGSKNSKLLKKIRQIQKAGYEIITRDYTNDLEIPVFRTWIVNPENYSKYATNGFGASLDPEIAFERSVTEAVQSAGGEDLVDIEIYERGKAEHLSNDPCSVYNLNYFITKDIKQAKDEKIVKIEKYKYLSQEYVGDILRQTVAILQNKIKDIDIVFVDLTREAIGIPVVRVLVVGDFQPVALPMISVSPRTFLQGKKDGSHGPKYEDLYMGIYPH